MRVLVCGGRDHQDRDRVFATLDEMHSQRCITEVIHGACGWDADKPGLHTVENLRGADRWAHEWALEARSQPRPYPASWSTLGRSAGPIRNQRMLDEGEPDVVVAFPGGRGTADTVRRATVAGVEVRKGRTR